MRSMLLKLSIAFMAVILGSSVALAASLGIIKGQVSDSEGAVIKGAHLLFHPDASGQARSAMRSDVTRVSDAAGRFEVQLEPGFYDVCIMATAFTPECKKVLVVDGGAIQHDGRLKADPLVMQHLGDKF
jgi:hypothetical protein